MFSDKSYGNNSFLGTIELASLRKKIRTADISNTRFLEFLGNVLLKYLCSIFTSIRNYFNQLAYKDMFLTGDILYTLNPKASLASLKERDFVIYHCEHERTGSLLKRHNGKFVVSEYLSNTSHELSRN